MGDIMDMTNEGVELLLKEHNAPGSDIEEVTKHLKYIFLNVCVLIIHL